MRLLTQHILVMFLLVGIEVEVLLRPPPKVVKMIQTKRLVPLPFLNCSQPVTPRDGSVTSLGRDWQLGSFWQLGDIPGCAS
jgi:hypothetical protein